MCGVAGFLQPGGLASGSAEALVRSLADLLRHRGPDDCGTWVDAPAGIALGHRRLSILDLSTAGHQPMLSAAGRYVIAFNGEIYNHLQIREELAGLKSQPLWRGHADTETLLTAFDTWGIEPTLRKAVGMFAFALWDRHERKLTLARDRAGEKPLYYGWQNGVFLFGSELKALRAQPAFAAAIDVDVLERYLRTGYIAAPHSIYTDIFKLLPGTYLQVPARHPAGTVAKPTAYWSLHEIAARGIANPYAGTDADAIAAVEKLLSDAVALQSIADVPLGAFLSGGIDSSTIVALMQAQSTRPVKTFTIGFREARYEEAQHAKAVAHHLGTDHTELYVTAPEVMAVIPKLPALYDEPFGDSSAIPTYLLCELARRHVTVSLSGDGGDELFGGYRRYQRTANLWHAMRRVPYFARNALARGAKAFSRGFAGTAMGLKSGRLALYLSARTAEDCYRIQLLQNLASHDLILPRSGDALRANIGWDSNLCSRHLYDAMMYADAAGYLPDDILVKVDRASMGVSLETRIPMLDHRVVEFAWSLPVHLKVLHGEGKWLLKQILRKYVPMALTERPKMGFGVPVGQWIRGPLRGWAEELLSPDRLRDGPLDGPSVRGQWMRHLKGIGGRR